MEALPAIFLGVAVVAFAGVVVLARLGKAERRAALVELARRRGWTFLDEVPAERELDLTRFEVLSQGRSRELRNVSCSPPGGVRALVFDYSYVTGSGKSRRRHRQTIYYAAADTLDLPAFSLRPERFVHRVAGLLGYQDIDVPSRPEFSRLFLLRGTDEARIRAAFREGVLRFFESRPGVCAAGTGQEVLLWRAGGFATPDEVESLIRAGEHLTAHLSGVDVR